MATALSVDDLELLHSKIDYLTEQFEVAEAAAAGADRA